MTSRSLIRDFSESLADRDFDRFASLLAPEVRFFGMLSSEPAVGAKAVVRLCAMLVAVCDEVEYLNEYVAADGVVLRSRGRVGGCEYEALQLLRLDESGRVLEFHDTLRPVEGLDALQRAVAAYISAKH